MKNTALLIAVIVAMIQQIVNGQSNIANGKDYCIPGSDSLCKRWGDDYCCAKIIITKDGFTKQYHACASASGIEAMDGEFNGGGYSGKWYCAGAMEKFK